MLAGLLQALSFGRSPASCFDPSWPKDPDTLDTVALFHPKKDKK